MAGPVDGITSLDWSHAVLPGPERIAALGEYDRDFYFFAHALAIILNPVRPSSAVYAAIP